MSSLFIFLRLVACSGGDYEVHENLPDLDLPTATIDFDEVVVGLQSEVGIAIDNLGMGVLKVEDLQLDDSTSPDFTILGMDDDQIAGGESGVLSVRYVPDAVGQDYGTIIMATNDPQEPEVEIELLGFGVEPVIDVDPEILWFGQIDVGASDTMQVQVAAAGTGTTRITDMVIEDFPGIFSYQLPDDVILPYALSAGFSFTFDVTFTPASADSYDTDLVISSNDPVNPTVAVRLLGNSEDDPTENAPPTVEITQPDWGNYLILGEATELRGVTVDVEDGPESLAAMWYVGSQLLGTSTPDSSGTVSLTTTVLPEGDITITLRAMDSEGLMGEDTVDVTVWNEEEPMLYVISGGTTIYDYWTVDDDVEIMLNGETIFQDANHTQDNHPPVEFEAEKGSTIRIVATDYNYCQKMLDALFLHFGSGASQPLNDSICNSACESDACYDGTYSGPWPSVFLDDSYTIEIP